MQASWHSVGTKVAVFKYILPIKHIYHYARQAADLSVTLKNRDFQVEAGCAIVFCYLSAGLYKEALPFA